MKAKRGILILSILLGIVTAFGVYRLVQSFETIPEVTVTYQKVAVAMNTIPENTMLTAEMVQLQDIPEEAVHAEAITDLEQVIGTMTTAIIVKDEQILQSRLISQLGENPKKLSYRIPENMRAISIPINELSAVSGHIAEGDRIDILVTYNAVDFYPGYKPMQPVEDEVTPSDANESKEDTEEDESAPDTAAESVVTEAGEERRLTTIYTQFQMLEVLKIGTPGHLSEGGSLAGSMVLLVTPEQAEELVYVLNSGSITLLLRNPADEEVEDLEFYNADVFRDERGIE